MSKTLLLALKLQAVMGSTTEKKKKNSTKNLRELRRKSFLVEALMRPPP